MTICLETVRIHVKKLSELVMRLKKYGKTSFSFKNKFKAAEKKRTSNPY